MTVGRIPAEARAFARCLRELTELLDTGAGWCGVFWQRDPAGMRACLDGTELPPRDVLEALLQDLAARYGVAAAGRETVRARALHEAAAAAHDRRPGGRASLTERLVAMRREEEYAAERERELTLRLRAAAGADGPDRAPGLDVELAWARDDRERAAARRAELDARLAALDALRGPPAPGPPDPWLRTEQPDGRPGGRGTAPASGPGGGETSRSRPEAAPKRRPRGARYAVVDDDGGAPPATPGLPAPALRTAAPRGARYAGVDEPEPVITEDPVAAARAARAVADTVAVLVQLRAQGRTGEAHVLLCEAAGWPAVRLPVLAGVLDRAGLGADWTTLLWEAASQPLDRIAAVAAELEGAGLGEDGRRLLRQGVAGPASDIAAALLALDDAGGRTREVRALADAFVRVRTPEDAALVARTDPRRLAPLLLDAARQVSQRRYRDVVHALRVAGATP
ncbi:hypothetical protein [Streptomyces chryseus]|uniref:UL36 very large tegument protein n=1 Tax=Streptomyces chryseus TaxID=68186 RepID=A0ABQ3DKG9_9ACTN|nr:hypothetical protein [Streptomyces chryseus]GHB00502.1 hypothetical protein GCM10010346_24310 [Streptomyces chryseus]